MAMNSIPFITDDGEKVEFYVLEQTTIGGIRYLLVEEASGEDDTVYIMKEDSDQTGSGQGEQEELSCVFVEDEEELVSVMKVFEQLMEDTDIRPDF